MASGSSYNGWPGNSDPNAIGINSGFSVDGAKFPGGVKGGDVEVVFTHLVRDLFEIDPPSSKDYSIEGFWGYSWKQNTNNPSQLSCHASGTAIDYRAVAHPNVQGSSYIGWSSSQITQVKNLLSGKYQSKIAWLSYDSMHFEISGSTWEIGELADSLGSGGGDWFDMATKEDLREVVEEVLAESMGDIQKAVWSYKESYKDKNGSTRTLSIHDMIGEIRGQL